MCIEKVTSREAPAALFRYWFFLLYPSGSHHLFPYSSAVLWSVELKLWVIVLRICAIFTVRLPPFKSIDARRQTDCSAALG